MPGKFNLMGFMVFLILICFQNASSQQSDYKTVFGTDWDKADAFVSENEDWMKTICKKYNIPFPFAVAIVFPELVRYSALLDRIEISLLKTLYINIGEDYADFSIGPFQMKPSFAEQVNERAESINNRKIRNQFHSRGSFKSSRLFRMAVVEDLEDLKSQFNYLIAFIKICEFSYPENWKDETEKLRFFATVYNCGLDKSREFVEMMSDKKYFSTKLVKSETYSYSDISVYWYNSNQKRLY